jgi:hypothetical protein|tara:strand:+ start:194 stop:382 length:189 start_codon:yes stop_codon:yes gene_type:complete
MYFQGKPHFVSNGPTFFGSTHCCFHFVLSRFFDQVEGWSEGGAGRENKESNNKEEEYTVVVV